jgi:Patatin-like phospholipase
MLDGSGSFVQDGSRTLSSYSWRQIDGPQVDLNNKNIKTPSFKAPCIGLDFNTLGPKNPYVNLVFELIVTDDIGVSSAPGIVNILVKMIQRALVLQGGGSLGAYEAGVFKALCKELGERDKSRGNIRKNRPLFDIIAGTSIGAVNASIIIDNVLRLKRGNPNLDTQAIWSDAAKQLDEFWQKISILSLDNPLFWIWWDIWHINSKTWIENYRLLSEQNEKLSKLKEDYHTLSISFGQKIVL